MNDISKVPSKFLVCCNYLVKEVRKGLYKIDGILAVDEKFNNIKLSMLEFTRLYSNLKSGDIRYSPDPSTNNDKLSTFWFRWGYDYYIVNGDNIKIFGDLAVDRLNRAKFLDKRSNYIVAVSDTGKRVRYAVTKCLIGAMDLKNKLVIKPKVPFMVLREGSVDLSVFGDGYNIHVRPFGLNLSNKTVGARNKIVEFCNDKDADKIRVSLLFEQLEESYTPSESVFNSTIRLSKVDGAFVRFGDYCTINEGAVLGDVLVLPKNCKYFYLTEGKKDFKFRNIVFNSSIEKVFNLDKEFTSLSSFRDVSEIFFSKHTKPAVIVDACLAIFYGCKTWDKIPVFDKIISNYKGTPFEQRELLDKLGEYLSYDTNSSVKVTLY
jgi:hypothetical protein